MKRLEPGISSAWSGSYEKIEEELTEFERWLDTVWGMGFYETLIGNEESYSIPLAFKTAAEMEGNVLICDGARAVVSVWGLDRLIIYFTHSDIATLAL